MATAGQIRDDYRHISEEEIQIDGNVFDNDGRLGANAPGPYEDFRVIPGTLESQHSADDTDGVGKYGTLVLNEDGSYTYTITDAAAVNAFGEGVDFTEEFKYIEEWYDNNGGKHEDEKTIKITIHGENDQPKISDVTVSAYEGLGTGVTEDVLAATDPVTPFEGQLQLEDINPNIPGVQTDIDNGDTHKFVIDPNSIKVVSDDLTDAQVAAIKATVQAQLVNAGATDGNADFGKYTVQGNFDALSVGDEAKVTFDYYVVDESTSGATTPSDKKTVTMTVLGTNDPVTIKDDTIVTYDQLIDGDIYKSILANDGHYVGGNKVDNVDVNDVLTIASTGFHDLQFYLDGGSIDVDNAARMLQYTPGSGGAIAKDHFSFYYQATDGHTDPIGNALAEFEMINKNQEEIDFYQFGDNGSDRLCGIDGKTNVLSGMGGDDCIKGKEKGDILYGGAGDDTMKGNWGDDIYVAGKGTDAMVDTRGNDLYVFSKGDGRDTIEDQNLEIYTDAMGHETINIDFFMDTNEDIISFDDTVKQDEIAIFKNGDNLEIKYTKDDDVVTVLNQDEAHNGIEKIVTASGGELTKSEIDTIIAAIATTDIDANTAGIQTAQSVEDVQNSAALMAVIAQAW